ncbi:MAG: HDOD domain-containing protein [Gallionella sp.]|nr:HDOD domain-containing protein [Gallionella sp.]
MEKNAEVIELVKGVGGLVTLPNVFIRINQLIDDPDSSVNDIAQAISQDPSFTVRLLRVANSPFYGFSSSIDTVAKAAAVIGTSQIRNLALSMSVASSFAGLPNHLVSMDNFWRHSLYCALAARILARQAGRVDPEAMFTAGLLHDIGELVIFNRRPDQAKDALLLVLDSMDELPVHLAEQQTMGFDHAQVGGELVQQWSLPPLLRECIAYHHDIARAQQYPREVALIHLANKLALMAEVDTLDVGDVAPCDPQAWAIAGLDESVIEQVVREVQEEVIEAEKLFVGN